MKFRYLGKERMVFFGHDFSGGKTPDVMDATAIRKLSGNRFFEKVEDQPETEPVNEEVSHDEGTVSPECVEDGAGLRQERNRPGRPGKRH
jgi:hypothetical protein